LRFLRFPVRSLIIAQSEGKEDFLSTSPPVSPSPYEVSKERGNLFFKKRGFAPSLNLPVFSQWGGERNI
jgi:hypothetical protein